MFLLALIFGVLILVAILLAATHFWGLAQPVVDYPLPFFDQVQIVLPWEAQALPEKVLVEKLRALGLQELSAKKGWHLPIVVNSSGELRILGTGALPDGFLMSKHEDRDLKTTPLEAWLSKNRSSQIYLQIFSNTVGVHEKVAQALPMQDWKNQILIQSDADTVVQAMKDLRPQFAFASSAPDRMRLLTFQSMWVLPATPFNRDVWVGPLEHQKLALLNEEILEELHRRRKRILIGPLANRTEIERAQKLQADVLLLSPKAIDLPSEVQ